MFDQFRNHFSIDDDKWSDYISRFKRMEVPSKTTLLQEGDVSKKLFLIEKGCLRAWFNNDGKDVTFQFFFESQTVASVESFRKHIPSPVSIESIEPSIVWWIHKKDMDVIIGEINENPSLRHMFINAIFERTYDYMKHFFSFIKDTPVQRYQNLINESPQVVQRVPQHYIASYLGITTVHLSRIKSKLAKRKESF